MTNETMMKGILHALNSIAGSLNPEYQPLDERIYDNQQRAFIIQKAKDYIKEKRRRYKDNIINFDWSTQIGCMACIIIDRRSKEVTHRGIYQDHLKRDYETRNDYISSALALANALGEVLPWTNDIPQPNMALIRHYVEYEGTTKTILRDADYKAKEEAGRSNKYCTLDSNHAIRGKIISDTNVNYGPLQIGESDI